MSPTKTIEVEHLSKIYGSTTAIEDVHFSVEAGEIVGFLGPNGAGKTTTMRILAGYLPATAGTAKIAGYDVHREAMAVRRCIGYLPEHPPLYLDMTVKGFLHFVAKIKGVAAGERQKKVESAIARCQLSDRANTIIHKLSKGYRQRVGIASAIVHEPPVIILDEPTVGLDPRQIIEVRNLIKSLAGEHTIILSTHILPEVSMTCDRVTIINKGKVVATNTPGDLKEQLHSSSEYEIEVAGDVDRVLPLIQEIDGVASVNILPRDRETQVERTLLKILCKSDLEPGNIIATILVQNNLELFEMRRNRPSLEDVFLQLTTEEPKIKSNE
jgi:ABC-2 type transport system ATP-binding protein